MGVIRPSSREGREMRRGVWATVAACGDQYFRKAVKHRTQARGREASGRKFWAEKFKDQPFGQAEQIGLWALAVTRRVLRNSAEQQTNGFPAGLLHGTVNCVSGLFWGYVTGRFKRRR